MTRALVFRELGGAVVWIEGGRGWRHDGTGWHRLADNTVSLSGWVVCAGELDLIIRGRGRPAC